MSQMNEKKHIYLIGFMGTGKTTVSDILHKKLGWPEIDADALIVKEQKMPIAGIFEQYGEPYFRELESEMMRKIAKMDPAVVSCGGGAVLRSRNVETMAASGTIVLLTATPETVFTRVRHSKDRPILNGHMEVSYIAELMEKRRAAYEAAAGLIVVTDDKYPRQVADEIIRRLNLQ